MHRRIFLALVGLAVCLGLAACSPQVAKSGLKRALDATVSKITGKASPPPSAALSDAQCQAVEPVEPGYCYSPSYAGGALCQPQCIPYARCRTGSTSCQLGNTSPVQWFLCEQARGYTSAIPQPGSLMAIGINHRHHITTGHTLYVEEVCANADGTYKLRVSHSNYDRRCHLEEDALVHYDPNTMEADFLTGNWAPWGEDLPVQGFILQEPAPSSEKRPPRQTAARPATGKAAAKKPRGAKQRAVPAKAKKAAAKKP